jgi:hypothetical protein
MTDWMATNVHALLGIKGIEIRDYGSKVMSGFKKGALVKCGLATSSRSCPVLLTGRRDWERETRHTQLHTLRLNNSCLYPGSQN